jgi:hypothetical protein
MIALADYLLFFHLTHFRAEIILIGLAGFGLERIVLQKEFL